MCGDPRLPLKVPICSELFISVFDELWGLVFQLDIFEHVGVPLVEHCLASFNGSVLYGQVFLLPVDF